MTTATQLSAKVHHKDRKATANMRYEQCRREDVKVKKCIEVREKHIDKQKDNTMCYSLNFSKRKKKGLTETKDKHMLNQVRIKLKLIVSCYY